MKLPSKKPKQTARTTPRDEERMVKDEFTDAGCTGVIHLNRRNQSWVGWQNEQPETAAKDATAVSGETFRARAIGISALAVAA
jgi:hypothetical protein